MRLAQSAHHFGLALDRIDGLEAVLGDALLAANLSDARPGPFAGEESTGALRVPGAALVAPDSPRARGEQRLAHTLECREGNEDDQLALHGAHLTGPSSRATLEPCNRFSER